MFLCMMGLASSVVQAAAAPEMIHVSGTVVDAAQKPVPGALVYVEHSNYATTTGENGAFSLSVPAGADVRVSILGYKEYAFVATAAARGLVIVLEEEASLLDEIVVVGYGVQKRSDITGSVASVDTEEIKKIPTTNIAEMLRGNVAGVQVELGSAAPGGTSSILIRGRRSLSGDNAPLFVVDGVYMRTIDDLDGADIQSMEILKDAAAQAIYGARAANGVILITTKGGRKNARPSISYDTYVAVQQTNRNFEYWSPEEWIDLRIEAYKNKFENYDEELCFGGELLRAKNEKSYINWEELAIKPAIQYKHNISIAGGGKDNTYALSLGYYNQDGMIANSWFNRVNGRLSFTQKMTDWLSFGTNISFNRGNRRSSDSKYYQIMTTVPIGFVYDDEGNLNRNVSGFAELAAASNPLWDNKESNLRTVSDRLNGIFYADVNFGGGFSYRLNTSYSTRISDTSNYYSTLHNSYTNVGGRAEKSNTRTTDWLVENIFNYVADLSKTKHSFDATLMQSISGSMSESYSIAAQGMVDDTYGADAINMASDILKPSWGWSDRRIVSFLARARYSYNDRYLLSAAIRCDGSSVFGASHKFGYFPSVSAAWRINKEPFMEGTKQWLSNLKLRLSYGEVGNQAIDPYTTLGVTGTYYSEFGSTAVGFLPSTQLYNPDLKWETSATTNIGIDFGFFKDRINGSVEVYNTDTRDLLVTRSLPTSTGYASQLANLGKVNNKGIEVTLNTVPVSTRDFHWDLNFTWSRNVNKIVAIDGSVDENGDPVNDLNNNWFIGKPISVFRDYKMLGIFSTADAEGGENSVISQSNTPDRTPGQIHTAELDGDGKQSEGDKILYNKDPDWLGGITTAFYWKNFDVSATFDCAVGGWFKNSLLYDTSKFGTLDGRSNGVKREYWTVDNQVNTMYKPVLDTTMSPDYQLVAIASRTYFRFRNFSLGYTLPKAFVNKIHLSNVRFYLAGTNLFYHTNTPTYGPGSDLGAYPQSRMFQLGLNITF